MKQKIMTYYALSDAEKAELLQEFLALAEASTEPEQTPAAPPPAPFEPSAPEPVDVFAAAGAQAVQGGGNR